MTTLRAYLLRETLGTLLLAVAVCTGLLLLGNLLKEILALLVVGQATPGTVLRGVALLVPYVLTFALPMGMLAASLLVFGRLSADQEITAARANGISLAQLALPVVLLSLAFCGLCAWVNLDLGPRCRVAFKQLVRDVAFRADRPPIIEGRFITDLPGLVIYAGKVRGEELEDVLFYELKDGRRIRDLRAPRARLRLDATNRLLHLTFYDARALERITRRPAPPDTNAPPAEAAATDAPPDAAAPDAPAPAAPEEEEFWQPVQMAEMELPPIALPALAGPGRRAQLSDLTFRELRAEAARLRALGLDDTTAVAVQQHRQVAFSFASFAFTLVGIPLGIRAHRRETSIGLALATVLLLAYYAFVVTGQALATRPELLPQFILWAPNFLFQGLGAWLLWRADRA
jgi:lipopolysaccharide export system permease protein